MLGSAFGLRRACFLEAKLPSECTCFGLAWVRRESYLGTFARGRREMCHVESKAGNSRDKGEREPPRRPRGRCLEFGGTVQSPLNNS